MPKMTVTPTLYSISGPPRSGRTSTFENTKLLCEKYYPQLPIVFLPDVFEGRPHPLERPMKEREYHAVSRLLRNWGKLNESCLAVRRELAAGNIVVTDGFGLDVYLDAVACKDCPEQKAEASLLHHYLVDFRVKEQGIPFPQYFTWRTWHGALSDALRSYHSSVEMEMARYFSGTGQKEPIYLDGGDAVERSEEALQYILTAVEMEAAA
jgi:hypothetical protein